MLIGDFELWTVTCSTLSSGGAIHQQHTRTALHRNAQYLDLRHVNASDVTLLPHQLTEHVAIPAASTAQVQDPATLQGLGYHQATTIVPVEEEVSGQRGEGTPRTTVVFKPNGPVADFVVHFLKGLEDEASWGLGRGHARIGVQVR